MSGYDVFGPSDLAALEALLDQAFAVERMDRVATYHFAADVIGMRHDVDNLIEPAVRMARWEAARGYRSTYFILHTAPYWRHAAVLGAALDEIAGLGHEIGLHVNALAEAVRTGRDPLDIFGRALEQLRSYGHPVRGVVAHGDPACYIAGRVRFVNDELFQETPRPTLGAPDRTIEGTNVRIAPVPRSEFGLDYDPNWLPRADYISDSGGRWSKPLPERLPEGGQLHMLVHPDWWGRALR